ncbi:Structural maintenance of chromosomes protein 6 [Zootermopsis nevadensis]|uniref:Structural maintenance of chromosomes protein 6 n=1 Tax=Zootermopsis nevadensis TaxID=136037 RepID=A0A067QTT7_ZOONE|nr:Structural maintenance of chromosomes protein 6 [Zootermopsis nevadensis]
MKDFMCHSSLEVRLNPRGNFIVGRNVSGKTAIIAALVLGLGGNPRAIKRHTTLQEFIKKGKDTATIEITLKNTGHLNYEREQYGDHIIVRRCFNATGRSTYEIKSEEGEFISRKEEELDKIVSAFNI